MKIKIFTNTNYIDSYLKNHPNATLSEDGLWLIQHRTAVSIDYIPGGKRYQELLDYLNGKLGKIYLLTNN